MTTRQQNINRFVRTIEEIPTLPVISQRLQSLFSRDDVTLSEIVNIIECDPPLAAKLLKLVNSSFYGLLSKVSSIEHAVVILGFAEVRNVVLGVSVQNHFADMSDHFDPTRFWKHSIICSQVAKHLCKQFNVIDDGTFFLSGLIHDIGKLAMAQYFTDEFHAVLDAIEQDRCSFSQAERKVVGITHYQVAAKLLQHWRFPRKVILQVFYHHAPWHDTNFANGSIVLYLANVLTKISGYDCYAAEQPQTPDSLLDARVLNYLNKNGFELDQPKISTLITRIAKFIQSEEHNVLNLFV